MMESGILNFRSKFGFDYDNAKTKIESTRRNPMIGRYGFFERNSKLSRCKKDSNFSNRENESRAVKIDGM